MLNELIYALKRKTLYKKDRNRMKIKGKIFHSHEHPVGQQERVLNGHRKINRHSLRNEKSRKDGNVKES